MKIEGWGVHRLIESVGIERRSYSKGQHKTFLDPFQPEDKVVSEHVEKMILTPLFDEFKRVLRAGRGAKLSDDPKVLSGLVWTGAESVDLGLADEIVDSWTLREKLKNEYGVDTIIAYNKKRIRVQDLLTAEFYAEVLSHTLLNISESSDARAIY